jgi:NitT/TauT family transport system ATP-binding protein
MLKVEGVSKRFGPNEGQIVLEGIDLTVPNGEFLCLLGASGCGKTTLLNILAGFETVSSGRVTLDGAVVVSGGRDRVMVFQDAGSALFPWQTVSENVEFGLRLQRVPKPEREALCGKFLQMVGLEKDRAKFPAELSGGMRQRLQIARALAIDPRILLMDEPFGALDAITKRRMHAELVRIWGDTKKSIVFVTHDIAEAISLADRIAVMTVGPRSRIKDVMEIALPRPRDPADPEFGRLFSWIEDLLGEGTGRPDGRRTL